MASEQRMDEMGQRPTEDGLNRIYYSYELIDKMIISLLHQIEESGRRWSVVVGIANGGLYPSIMIAKALGLPHEIVRISWYDGKQKRDTPLVLPNEKLWQIGGSRLVVDDLIDGGNTMLSYKDRFGFGNYDDMCVLFYNQDTTNVIPSYYASNKPNGWIVFPWEKE